MLKFKAFISILFIILSSSLLANDLELIPSYEIGVSGVGDVNTISSGPDNGANGNMRRLFWKSMGHSTTDGAVNNFLSRLPLAEEEGFRGAGNLNIGGHGNEGFLETGSGQDGNQDYKTNIMSTWNSFIWGPQLQRLRGKSYPIMYVYSCHTGAGERGADFLFELAKQTKKPSAARTGFTYSNNKKLWFEKGSSWQVSTPDSRPTPIPAPTPHFTKLTDTVELYIDKKITSVKITDITEVAIESSNAINGVRTQVNIDKSALRDFVAHLFGSKPYALPGEPLAQVTAKISLTIKNGKKEKQLKYSIYNNRLAVSEGMESAHYARAAIADFY